MAGDVQRGHVHRHEGAELMRRLFLALALLLTFAIGSARASYLPYTSGVASNIDRSGTGTSLSVTTPSSKTTTDVYTIVLMLTNGATPTISPSGPSCTTATGAYSVTTCTVSAASAASSYTFSWTGGAISCVVMWDTTSTDGLAPVVDVQTNYVSPTTISSLAMPQVTTTSTCDLVYFVVGSEHATNPETNFSSNGVVELGAAQYNELLVGYLGQSAAGATSTAITANNNGGTSTMVAVTITFKGNGSACFVGHSGNVGGSTGVSPTFPVNSAGGDGAVVVIGGRGTTGYTVTPPPDVLISYSTNVGGSNPVNIPLGTHAQVGQPLLVIITPYDAGSWTANVTSSGTGTWAIHTFNDNGQQLTWALKTCTSGDLNNNIVASLSGDTVNASLIVLNSFSGGTITSDASSHGGQAAGSGSFPMPSITTLTNYDLLIGVAMQAGGAGWSVPAGTSTLLRNGSYGVFISPQPTAGLVPTQTITGGSSGNAWEGLQLAWTTGAGSPFTHIGSTIDPTNSVQLDAFQAGNIASGLGGGVVSFTTSASSSLVADLTEWGNVNATTPVDTSCFFSIPGAPYGTIPSCTPSSNDELFFGAQTHPNQGAGVIGVLAPLIDILSSPDIEDGYGSSNLTGPSYTGSFNTNNAYASAKFGIEGANTPARGTTNLRLNQEFLMLFSQYPIGQCNGCGGIGVMTP